MIYLIGGPPKCGKTTLAKKLSKKLELPWISADTLQSVVYAYTNKREIPKKFPWGEIRKKTKGSNDLAYKKYSSSEIIKLYRKQAGTSYKAIEIVVASEINDGNDYIVEGYQVEPKLVKKLLNKYGKDKIKSVFLIRIDKSNFLEDIKKSSTPNDWILAKTKKDETFPKIAEMIYKYGIQVKKDAVKYGLRVLNMDSNFREKLEEIINYLK